MEAHTCLFSTEGKPLMPLIKAGASRAEIQAAVRSIWTERSDAYSEERNSTQQPSERVEMSYIGG